MLSKQYYTVTLIDRLAKSVAQVFNKSKTTIKEPLVEQKLKLEEKIKPVEMRSSGIKLAKAGAYVPSIKFVGGRHPIPSHSAAGPHPCAVDHLMPGSAECSKISDVMSKWAPFTVVPYVNAKAAKAGSSKYVFVNRPLEKDEVASISELPARFRFRPIDEQEMDVINHGGI